MSQYRYNRRPRASTNQCSTQPKELLHSTHLNLTKYELSKHQIYNHRNNNKYALRFNKSHLHNSSIDPINSSLNYFRLPMKLGSVKRTAESQPFYSAKLKKQCDESEQVSRSNVRELMLINRNSMDIQDRFPQMCAKKFNLKKVEKLFRRVQQLKGKEGLGVRGRGGFEPWQMDEQLNDFVLF